MPLQNTSKFVSAGVSDLAITLWTDRISKSLVYSSTPSSKRFWNGFIVGLFDYDVISHKDYRWLRNEIVAYD